MALPSDLEIFWPLAVHQPCANTVLGSGRPAASSMVGQYTAWWRRMSLPMTCTAWGQNLSYCAVPTPPSALM